MAGRLAVVLSGGGAKGAFQVGVLDALIREKQVCFDIAVGTSTGAIQAAAVAQDDIAGLLGFWQGIKGPDDIYRKKSGALWAIITGQSSLYSVDGLRQLLGKAFSADRIRATGKSLRIAVVNITNGDPRVVGENAENIADWIYASCAMPFVFPPQGSRDAAGFEEQWVDGGVRDVTPIAAAMHERPSKVLVIRASPPAKPPAPKHYGGLVNIALRCVDIQSNEVSKNDVENVEMINRLLAARDHQRQELTAAGLDAATIARIMQPFEDEIVRYRFVPIKVIEPGTALYETLDFDPKLLAKNIDLGREYVRQNWTELAQFLGVNP